MRWLADPDDRAFVSGIVDQAVTTVLASVLAVSGVLVLVSDGGAALEEPVGPAVILGGTLFLFGFVLAARALAVVFRRRD
ncbi:hypothetical protein [Ornithinimicrobium tianjinense]|uniref:Uncharacterized protein n=1 Tax=Ornithinimicrobium tianjinense TaxID=1195761 RepID=A0A917BIR7_9MICO|nr:hypothetical protein [Ornithinimicrobium tianjinense]GGF41106.1 hypothetical protein GCM10011366_05990 [Ornithinimicrobium tianjinense]